MNKLARILVAWLLIGALPAFAAEQAGTGITWESLDESTQDLLAGQKERWNSLPPERQRAMADGAERWLSMNDADRAQARERWKKWRGLPPGERERLRKRWKQFRDLTPEQKEALRESYRRFMSLPPEQREVLRERWQRMSPEERRRAIQRRQAPRPARAPAAASSAEDSHPAHDRGRIVPTMPNAPLKRSHDRMIAGVCGGLAEWLGWKADHVRIAYVLVSILSVAFPGIIAYLLLWLLMPDADAAQS